MGPCRPPGRPRAAKRRGYSPRKLHRFDIWRAGARGKRRGKLGLLRGRRGKVSAVYRKVQLYGGDESDAFAAGDELLVVELCGVKIGLMICFDVEFPEVARALARGGAEMLVTISANMEPFGNDHAVFCSARALENGLPHVYVNQVGPWET